MVLFGGSVHGAVVRVHTVLAFHQCDSGSIPRLNIISGLSLLLVLILAPRGFSLDTPVFTYPQKPTLINYHLVWTVSPISALC